METGGEGVFGIEAYQTVGSIPSSRRFLWRRKRQAGSHQYFTNDLSGVSGPVAVVAEGSGLGTWGAVSEKLEKSKR